MMREAPKIGVTCADCGNEAGEYDERGELHCANCGNFAEKSDYCPKHDFDPSEDRRYNECPMCKKRRRVENERQEMMQRRANPRMHSTIDAPRY